MAPGIASDPFCGALWLWLPPNTAWNDVPLRSLQHFFSTVHVESSRISKNTSKGGKESVVG